MLLSHFVGSPVFAIVEAKTGLFSERFNYRSEFLYLVSGTQFICSLVLFARALAPWSAMVLTGINALIKRVHKLPRELYRSLTWDRGKEMADHERFRLVTDIKVYFCDPQHPWQRASNENTNGLLRQYFPKGLDLSNVHQNRLNAVARRLNERSRETLQFYSPAEKLGECVASTG